MGTFGEQLNQLRSDVRERRIGFYSALLELHDDQLDASGLPRLHAFLDLVRIEDKKVERLFEDYFESTAYPELGVVGPKKHKMKRLVREAKCWSAESFVHGWDVQCEALRLDSAARMDTLLRVAALWGSRNPGLARLECARPPEPFVHAIVGIVGPLTPPHQIPDGDELDGDGDQAVPPLAERTIPIFAKGIAQAARNRRAAPGEILDNARGALADLGFVAPAITDQETQISAVASIVKTITASHVDPDPRLIHALIAAAEALTALSEKGSAE